MSTNNPDTKENKTETIDEDVVLGYDAETDNSVLSKDDEDFQKEFKAVFDDSAAEKKKFAVFHPDGAVSGVFDWIRCVIVAVAIVVFCLTFIFRIVEVDGSSMMDTLSNSDKVIVTNLFYTPKNNDIIVISHASNYNKPIIKRVIATEGQTVKLDFKNDKIYVDGVEINEPYIKGTTFSRNGSVDELNFEHDADGTFVVPEGKLFVMGDNRAVSLDSRSEKIGLIDVKEVIGKAQLVVWPFNHFGSVYD